MRSGLYVPLFDELADPAVVARLSAEAEEAGWDGVSVDLEHPDQLAEMVAGLAALRREAGRAATDPYDIVAALPPGADPVPYGAAGATWWLVEFPAEGVSIDQVRGVTREGPTASA
jgi:hypothetical protein